MSTLGLLKEAWGLKTRCPFKVGWTATAGSVSRSPFENGILSRKTSLVWPILNQMTWELNLGDHLIVLFDCSQEDGRWILCLDALLCMDKISTTNRTLRPINMVMRPLLMVGVGRSSIWQQYWQQLLTTMILISSMWVPQQSKGCGGQARPGRAREAQRMTSTKPAPVRSADARSMAAEKNRNAPSSRTQNSDEGYMADSNFLRQGKMAGFPPNCLRQANSNGPRRHRRWRHF